MVVLEMPPGSPTSSADDIVGRNCQITDAGGGNWIRTRSSV